MKKLLLTLGTATAVVAPLTTTIACGKDEEKAPETPTDPSGPSNPATGTFAYDETANKITLTDLVIDYYESPLSDDSDQSDDSDETEDSMEFNITLPTYDATTHGTVTLVEFINLTVNTHHGDDTHTQTLSKTIDLNEGAEDMYDNDNNLIENPTLNDFYSYFSNSEGAFEGAIFGTIGGHLTHPDDDDEAE